MDSRPSPSNQAGWISVAYPRGSLVSLRDLKLGPSLRLVFEDPKSTHRDFHQLIPDSKSLLASMMLQLGSPPSEPPPSDLAHRVYAEIEGHGRNFASLESKPYRDANHQTSSGQLLRFEFSPAQIVALHAGADFGFGIDDDRMRVGAMVKREMRASLLADLE